MFVASAPVCLVGLSPLTVQPPPILDTARLAALRQAVGGDALASLAARFGPAVDKDLVSIRSGLAAGDRKKVAEAAHSLKGLAVTFGADRLQAAAQALQSGAEGSVDLDTLIADIAAAAEATKGAVPPAVASLP